MKSSIYCCFPGVLVKAWNSVSTAVFQVFGQSMKSSINNHFPGVLVKAQNPVFTSIFQVFCWKAWLQWTQLQYSLVLQVEKQDPSELNSCLGICTFSILCFLVLWSEYDFMVQHLEKSVSHTQMSVHIISLRSHVLWCFTLVYLYTLAFVGLNCQLVFVFCFVFIVEFQQPKRHIFILWIYYEW